MNIIYSFILLLSLLILAAAQGTEKELLKCIEFCVPDYVQECGTDFSCYCLLEDEEVGKELSTCMFGICPIIFMKFGEEMASECSAVDAKPTSVETSSSITPSPSSHKSAAQTGTGSKSPTETGSKSPTGTGSKSPTETGSKSPTGTGSKSPTGTGSKSPTETGSESPTKTGSKSPTGTVHATETLLPSTSTAAAAPQGGSRAMAIAPFIGLACVGAFLFI